MSFDLTAAQGVFKRVQTSRLNEVLYSVERLKANPGFASLKTGKGSPIQTKFGSAYALVVQSARGGATSADVDTTEESGASAAPGYDQFLVTPAKLHTSYEVEGDVLDRCQDEGAFINAAQKVVKDAMDAHVRKMCILTHGIGTGLIDNTTGLGSGAIAVIQSAPTASPSTITVLPSQVRNIERGDRLVAADDETAGALRSSTALTVIGRNTVTGLVTLSGDPTALNWASGDYVYWKGMRNIAPTGYFVWDPAVEVTSGDDLFQVDRSVDPVRLGGNRFDANNKARRAALIEASLAAIAEGAQPTRVRVSPEDFAALAIEGEALPSFVASVKQGETTIGFNAMMLAGVGPVLMDESLPAGHAMIEDEGNFQILSDDGKLVHRQPRRSHLPQGGRRPLADQPEVDLPDRLSAPRPRPPRLQLQRRLVAPGPVGRHCWSPRWCPVVPTSRAGLVLRERSANEGREQVSRGHRDHRPPEEGQGEARDDGRRVQRHRVREHRDRGQRRRGGQVRGIRGRPAGRP